MGKLIGGLVNFFSLRGEQNIVRLSFFSCKAVVQISACFIQTFKYRAPNSSELIYFSALIRS